MKAFFLRQRATLGWLILSLFVIFIGCLGGGGGGGGSFTGTLTDGSGIYGNITVASKGLTGGIPIEARNISSLTNTRIQTDEQGNFIFSALTPGLYDLYAITGDCEILFQQSVQVTDNTPRNLGSFSLLALRDVILYNVSTSTAEIEFRSNLPCYSAIEFGEIGIEPITVNVSKSYSTSHSGDLSGMTAGTAYECRIILTTNDGQKLTYFGLIVTTSRLVGPTLFSIAINSGAFETSTPDVTLTLKADNAESMRLSETDDLSAISWQTYVNSLSYSFSNRTDGKKKIFVQFRDSSGNESPVLEDSIILNTSGYTGVLIESGKPVTGSRDATLSLFFNGATQMKISENSSFLNAFWENFAPNRKIRLSAGDGLKTVYVRFQGGNADPNKDYIATILLDTTPPNGGMKINNGATKTSSQNVTLNFSFSSLPTEMQLSNTTAPTATASWLSYRKELPWTLTEGEGAKTVYGNFRDAASNTLGPITAQIELDLTPPSGNTFQFLRLKDPASEVATYALPGSFPVYLHFTVTDSTTASAGYYRTEEDAEPPASSAEGWQDFPSPFRPVALNEKEPILAGTNKIWVRFGDEVGNFSTPTNQTFYYDGEQIIITPRSAKLFAQETLSLKGEGKNVLGGVGTINWKVKTGSGTVSPTSGTDTSFKAPNHIGAPIFPNVSAPGNSVIEAVSSFKPTLTDVATITLLPRIDIALYESAGTTLTEKYSYTLPPATPKTLKVKVLNPATGSLEGAKIGLEPGIGTAEIDGGETRVVGSYTVHEADLIYTPPSTVSGVLEDSLTIQAEQDPNVYATVSIRITDGPIISPSSGEAQRHRPLSFTATIANSTSAPINWSVSPSGYGTLSRTQTTAPPHSVTFAAGNVDTQRDLTLTAVDRLNKSSVATITVIPPILFRLSPVATNAMPLITPMTFVVDNQEYFGDASATFKWEFRNASNTTFSSADGNSYNDRGLLKVLTDTTAEYRRPTKLPASTTSGVGNVVEIKVSSTDDPESYQIATITIIQPVIVSIVKNFVSKERIATAATVAEVGKIQFYAQVTPIEVGDTSVTWTVNNTTGNTTIGTIDTNGKYTSPDTITINQVEVRATSVYDTSAFASVTLSLSDFWYPVRGNMTDQISGAPVPVTQVVCDPYTASGANFEVFAGTNGYGVFYREFSDLPDFIEPTANYSAGSGTWIPIPNLSSLAFNSDPKYIVNKIIVTPSQKILVATGSGTWYVERLGNEIFSAAELHPSGSAVSESNILSLAVNPRDETTVFIGISHVIQKGTLDFTAKTYALSPFSFETVYGYRIWETRTDSTASPPVNVEAYSNVDTTNPVSATIRSMVYDGVSNRLYGAGERNSFVRVDNTTSGNYTLVTNWVFTADAPSVNRVMGTVYALSASYNYTTSGIPAVYPADGIGIAMDIALDPNTPSTLWAAGSKGVYRSTDSGTSWESKSWTSAGSVVNTKCFLVDATNVVNVMSGSEDGLYRSTDAGGVWKRIQSGLGNHKTINSLTQATGEAGARRKVWVGTTGGVFIGRQSLDLQ